MVFIQTNMLGLIGVFFNIIGILILVVHLIFTKNKTIAKESILYPGYNEQEVKSKIDSRDKNTISTIYILLGTLLLSIDSFSDIIINESILLIIIVVLVLFFSLLSIPLYIRKNKKNFKIVKKYIEKYIKN